MADRFEDATRVRSGRRPFLLALAFVAFVACFAAPGATEPRNAVVGCAGLLAGNQIDLGPAFAVRLVRRIKHPVSLGIEAATGIAQEIPVRHAFPTFGPPPAPTTERLQFLDAIAIVGSRPGPYAIIGAGVYDQVTRMPGNFPPDPKVRHRVDAGFSGGVGYAGGGRVAPLIEYRVHIHGSAGGTSAPGSGSTLKALGIGSAGLMFRF